MVTIAKMVRKKVTVIPFPLNIEKSFAFVFSSNQHLPAL